MEQKDNKKEVEKKKSVNVILWLYLASLFIGVMFYNSCQTILERGFVLIGGIGFLIVSIPTVLSFSVRMAVNSKALKPTYKRNVFDENECKILDGVVLPAERETKVKQYENKPQAKSTILAERGKETTVDGYVQKHTKKQIDNLDYNNLRNYIIACFKNKLLKRETIILLKREIDVLLEDSLVNYSNFKFSNDAQEIYTKIKSSKFTSDDWSYLLRFLEDNVELPREEVS